MTMWWDEQIDGQVPVNLPAVLPAHGARSTASRPRAAMPALADDPYAWWWAYANRSAVAYRAGINPPEVCVYGPVLDADEIGLLTTELQYSRHYGGDGSWDRSDFLVFGRPAVMAGALAVNAALNHRRKKVAARAAVPQWRDFCQAPVIVTSHRVLCDSGRGWDSFWFGSITEFYPDLQNWSLTCGFEDAPPLRLVGPAAPAACLWAATAVLGDRWERDPRFSPLLALPGATAR